MPTLPLTPEEARALLRAAGDVDFDAGPGRDLYYEIERSSGGRLEGLIVAQDDNELTLVDVSTPANEHHTVAWNDIRRVSITGYS